MHRRIHETEGKTIDLEKTKNLKEKISLVELQIYDIDANDKHNTINQKIY